MNSILVLNIGEKKMTINPLPNDKILKAKNGRYAIVKTQFPWISLEDELSYSYKLYYS